MAYEFLDDLEFLQLLEKQHLKTTYVKIILLSYSKEESLGEIQGKVLSGNISVNGSSAVRRTLSLSMITDESNAAIANIENEISVKKKIQIFIGIKNEIINYEKYGKIVWFPQGTYILTSATVQRNTNNWTISIQGKDKMCQLDGTCGGIITSTTEFNKSEIHDSKGNLVEILEPTIFQIIFEAVNHWGEEKAENIIISDIENEIKFLQKYTGNNKIYFKKDYSALTFQDKENDNEYIGYSNGENVGYKMVKFVYPTRKKGDGLILKPGDTVVTLLNKIKSLLGNYEFYYDIWGRFIFHKIKNYLDTGSPLNELQEKDYTKSYNNAKFLYDLTKLDTTTAISFSPKYENIKNDFYAYGQQEDSSGNKFPICYHLAIDKKPMPEDTEEGFLYATKFMWEIKDIKNDLIIRYDFSDLEPYIPSDFNENWVITKVGNKLKIGNKSNDNTVNYEWREELYRRALNAQVTNSVYSNIYDHELLQFWKEIFDTLNDEWKITGYWNPKYIENPEKLQYWLDFIDSSSALGAYSISEIGRRTKINNNDSIKIIYSKEVPDVVFVEGNDSTQMAKYQSMGQKYFILVPQYYKLFDESVTGASCFDQIREMMYQHLNYNASISITCLPKYYLEPNNIIYIEDKKSNIIGNYQITQFSLPLTYSGSMNISATEVLQMI